MPEFLLTPIVFLLTAVLIVIVVGVAVGITIQRANQVAQTSVNKSITSAAKLFKQFEADRLKGLESVTGIMGSDPNFVAYIEAAMAGGWGNAARSISVPSGPAGIGLIGFAASQAGGAVRHAAARRNRSAAQLRDFISCRLNTRLYNARLCGFFRSVPP